MKNFIILLVFLFFTAACHKYEPVEVETQVEIAPADAFVHTAYFWFKEGTTSAQISDFKSSSEKLREIETVQGYYAGSPAPTTRAVIENSYDFAIVFLFKDLEAQEYYQKHPLHLELIEKHQDIWEKVMVTDVDLN